jgi:hypothetical protein
MLQARKRIITVLMAVARSGLTPFRPFFANKAVSEAKSAERSAKIHHIIYNLNIKKAVSH